VGEKREAILNNEDKMGTKTALISGKITLALLAYEISPLCISHPSLKAEINNNRAIKLLD
jgi:hypothetical protein